METLDLEEAAAFLKMSKSALRAKAKAGVIPGKKPAKQWVFIKEDLVAYLRGEYDGERRASRTGAYVWEKNCSVEAKAKPGITVSPRQEAVSRFEAALARTIGR